MVGGSHGENPSLISFRIAFPSSSSFFSFFCSREARDKASRRSCCQRLFSFFPFLFSSFFAIFAFFPLVNFGLLPPHVLLLLTPTTSTTQLKENTIYNFFNIEVVLKIFQIS